MKPNKNIEEFTKYLIKEADVEAPSTDFLSKVMNSIELESKTSSSIVYKPLISKSVWVLIAILIVAVGFFVVTGSTVNYMLLSKIDVSFIDKLPSINIFEKIHFSNTFTFSFVLFSILVLFQLVAIKNYFNKHNVT